MLVYFHIGIKNRRGYCKVVYKHILLLYMNQRFLPVQKHMQSILNLMINEVNFQMDDFLLQK